MFDSGFFGPQASLPKFDDYSGALGSAYYLTDYAGYSSPLSQSSYPYRPSASLSSSAAQGGPAYQPTGEMRILEVDLHDEVSHICDSTPFKSEKRGARLQ